MSFELIDPAHTVNLAENHGSAVTLQIEKSFGFCLPNLFLWPYRYATSVRPHSRTEMPTVCVSLTWSWGPTALIVMAPTAHVARSAWTDASHSRDSLYAASEVLCSVSWDESEGCNDWYPTTVPCTCTLTTSRTTSTAFRIRADIYTTHTDLWYALGEFTKTIGANRKELMISISTHWRNLNILLLTNYCCCISTYLQLIDNRLPGRSYKIKVLHSKSRVANDAQKSRVNFLWIGLSR